MASLADAVLDAALGYIVTNATKARVKAADDTVLVGPVVLDANNFLPPADNTGEGGGRFIQCLANDNGDMLNINVAQAGSATKVTLDSALDAVLVETAITGAPKVLGASDQVNLGIFNVILKDPA